MTGFHFRRGDSLPVKPGLFLRQILKGATADAQSSELLMQAFETRFAEARAYFARELEAFFLVAADQQRAKMFSAAFRIGVAANDHFLLLEQLDLDPGSASFAGLINGILAFPNQAFKPESARVFEQFGGIAFQRSRIA